MQFEPFAFFTSVNNYLTTADGSSLQLVAPNEIVAGFFFCRGYPLNASSPFLSGLSQYRGLLSASSLYGVS